MMTRVIWGSGPRSFLSQACRADRASKRACWIGIPTLYSLAPSPHRCHIIPGGTPGRPDAARLGFSDLSRSGLSAPQEKRGPVAAPTSAPQGKRGGEGRVIMSFTVGRWNRGNKLNMERRNKMSKNQLAGKIQDTFKFEVEGVFSRLSFLLLLIVRTVSLKPCLQKNSFS
jgi:hypothetical protein